MWRCTFCRREYPHVPIVPCACGCWEFSARASDGVVLAHAHIGTPRLPDAVPPAIDAIRADLTMLLNDASADERNRAVVRIETKLKELLILASGGRL